jgi:LuxR family transcriptional regulator, maltose regulon positive regulatory protein
MMQKAAKGLAHTSGSGQAPGSASLVDRPRLLDLVEQGSQGPFTLISAPAGSGKTVLLNEWMSSAADAATIVHVRLAPEHSNRRTFWLEVLAAMARARPELSGLAVPGRGRNPLAAIRDALTELEAPLRVALDDFHHVAPSQVATDVEWLIEHAPDELRLVVATRSDPPIRLQRMRVAGQMREIRASDLAFTPAEATELLAPLELPAADVETLWERSEGWAAGLRLAELSLHDHPDPSAFIAGFAGDDRAVSDYLMSEVVSGYDEDTLLFLLRTSIVDRLNGELAGTLAGGAGGAQSLRELERADCFVEALDTSGTWFRYHPLFAEVLRAELRGRLGDELPALHSAASVWYARHAQPLEAVRHAVAASDWQLAAEVIGAQWLVCLVHGSGATLRALAADIPEAVVNSDAELALAMAGLLLEGGEIENADELLVRANERAGQLSPERRRRFAVTSTATALYRARLDGDVAEALSAARLALDERWDRSVALEVRALTLANLGIAEFWANDHEQALEHLHGAAGLALEFGNDFVLFIAESYLGAVDAREGRLADARGHARTAIDLGERRGWADLPHMALAYTALATVHLWWNEVDEAERASELARDALGRSREPLLPPLVAQLRAWIHAVRGDPVTALEILRAGHPDGELPSWLRVTAAMIEAELWLSLGEPVRARRSLEAISSIEASDPAIAVARLELALGEPEDALRAIAGFLADEREPLMPTSRTDAWTIDAVARDAIHDEAGALRAIERALDLAEPRGYSNAIVRHGAPVRSLLRRRIAKGTAHRAFAGELLAVLEQEPAAKRSNGDPLLEPLSDRELTVLRFLPTMMSNAEIASEMFVSVNTVKTHLKHIYRKLDVSERRDAVRRGRELLLLSPGITDT